MKKRIFAFVLALILCIGLIPAAAMAEEAVQDISGITGAFKNGSFRLTQDITLNTEEDLYFYNGENSGKVTLDLNGHVLNLNGQRLINEIEVTITDTNTDNIPHYFKYYKDGLWVATSETEGAISVSDITGETIDGTIIKVTGGVITGATGTGKEGAIVNDTGKILNINNISLIGNTSKNGGAIANRGQMVAEKIHVYGCTATGAGGAVYISGKATKNIISNSVFDYCYAENGGAVYNNMSNTSAESCEITGSTFTNCKSGTYGGAIYNASTSCTLKISDCKIGNCTAVKRGGAVFSDQAIELVGGTITGNDAGKNGGGIYNKGSLTVTGKVCITGNTRGTASDNVYLESDKLVTIGTAGLDSGSNISVTTQTIPTENDPVAITNETTVDYSDYFHSDNSGYDARKYENGSSYLVKLIEPAVCEIISEGDFKGKLYSSIGKAIKAVGNTEVTIQMIEDSAEDFLVGNTQTITLDLNGHLLDLKEKNIINMGNMTITDSSTLSTPHYFKYMRDDVWENTEASIQTISVGTIGSETPNETVIEILGGVITGGKGETVDDNTVGGAIRNFDNGTLNISKVNIVGNMAGKGGAINNNGVMNADSIHIYGCSAENGGAIFNNNVSTSCKIENSDIRYCIATYGGALYNNMKSTASGCEITNSSISNCKATEGGAVINTGSGDGACTLTLTNSDITNCEATTAGAMLVRDTVVMNGGEISSNKAESGAGVFVHYRSADKPGKFTMSSDAVIKNNTASYQGGGVCVGDYSEVNIYGTITGNTAGAFGGGIVMYSGITVGDKVNVSGNTSGRDSKSSDNIFIRYYFEEGAENNIRLTIDTQAEKALKKGAYIGVNYGDGNGKSALGQITSNGTEDDLQYFHSDSSAYSVEFADEIAEPYTPAHMEIVEYKAVCTVKKTLSFRTGEELTLVLDGNEAGVFTITRNGRCFRIYDAKNNKYVSFNSKTLKVELSDTAFDWGYDDGLYTIVKKSEISRGKVKNTKTTYYLDFGNNDFTVKKKPVWTKVIEITNYDAHVLKYRNCGDYHTAVCKRCGEEVISHEVHDYNETDHECDCGKLDPKNCYVEDVRVSSRTERYRVGFLFFGHTVTEHRYTIKPVTRNIHVAKVEYSINNRHWEKGAVIVSERKINKFYIRITDSNGTVTKWVYQNNRVTSLDKE